MNDMSELRVWPARGHDDEVRTLITGSLASAARPGVIESVESVIVWSLAHFVYGSSRSRLTIEKARKMAVISRFRTSEDGGEEFIATSWLATGGRIGTTSQIR